MKDFRRILHAAVTRRDHPWCLATLVGTSGSSYRQPGARLLVAPDGRETIGFLSGGCLEEEIARQGGEVILEGVSRLVPFDTRKLFGCHGSLSVYLEKIPAAGAEGNFLTELAAVMKRRQSCQVEVNYAAGGGSKLSGSCRSDLDCPGVFVQQMQSPPRMVVFGDGPEVAPMRGFAAGLGWDFEAYAHPDELPGDFVPDRTTAAVVMTHKIGRDLSALHRLFPMGLPYIGLMGARRRQNEILASLTDFGGTGPLDGWLDNLHAPAGLDTGSESPEEIAFSILAEAAAVLAGRKGGFLKEKSGSIHALELRP
ncbi:MAG: Alanine dehydrogenase [Verrucomicrobiales bacterium]|nr:Alanine dehydrogenase [Verrucomicrobiales bacterium]